MIKFDSEFGSRTNVLKDGEKIGLIDDGKVVFLNTPATSPGLDSEDCRRLAEQIDRCCDIAHRGMMAS